MLFEFLLVITGAAFVLSPIWGFISRRLFTRMGGRYRNWLLGVQAALCLLGTLVLASNWSFSGVIADAFVLFLGYLAYSGLAFIVSAIRPRALTWVVTAVAMIPTLFSRP
jgi:hypothetical protein